MFAQGGYVPLARRLCAYIVEDGLHALLPPSVVICGPLSTKPDDPGYQAACETARLVAEAGYGIITGCGGIMEAASLGARESGALGALPGTASSIWQPPEAGGERVTLEVLMRWHSIGPQLLAAASAVRAFIIFPGDLASLSELIEAAMAIEAGLLDPVPLVLYGSAFWRDLVAWMREMLACACTGNGGTARLIHLCDDPCEIAASISAC